MRFMTIIAAAALLAGGAQAASTGDPAVVSVTSASAGYNGAANIRGYRFTALDDFSITALGFADADFDFFTVPGDNPGLATAHEVILWDSSGAALASATIGAGTTSDAGPGTIVADSLLSGVFRYEDLASAVDLAAGETYAITAFSQQFSGDRILQQGPSTSFTLSNLIQLDAGLYQASPTHVLPGTLDYQFRFNVGPSFLIAPEDDPVVDAAVPLPAALPLALSAFGLLGFAARRARRA